MKKQFMLLSVVTILGFTGCGNNTSLENQPENTEQEEMNHEEMDHSSSGELPEGLKEANNPTYEVGSEVIIETDHMEGMKGAEATIVGAYDTVAYAISYNPTTGGETVKNHKWVVHEEIIDAGDDALATGTEVITEADHMVGMNDATVEIVSAEQTTVYMVDYISTTDGEKVTNHKWVTESELSPK